MGLVVGDMIWCIVWNVWVLIKEIKSSADYKRYTVLTDIFLTVQRELVFTGKGGVGIEMLKVVM